MKNGVRYNSMFKRLLANSVESEQYSYDGTCCWEWTGHRQPRGYGKFSRRVPDKKNPVATSAHRAMAELALGRPLADNETVDHACLIPWCINYLHFRLITKAQNTADMRARRSGRPRQAFEPLIDETLYIVDRFIRSLPKLRSSLNMDDIPF